MKFLNIKTEQPPPSSSQVVTQQEVFLAGSLPGQIVSSLSIQESISYFPKVDPKSHHVLLVPTKDMSGVSAKRSSTKGPKHKDLQEDDRYYCENCKCNYSRKQLLTNHIKYNCLKTQKDFVCEDREISTTVRRRFESTTITSTKKNFYTIAKSVMRDSTSELG